MAIIDLFSRKVLSWRVSNTLDAELCVAALDEAVALYGIPAIFNTDQGCLFTSEAFTGRLEEYVIRISMDRVNRALVNIFVERLWRSLKYEDIYIRDYRQAVNSRRALLDTSSSATASDSIRRWITRLPMRSTRDVFPRNGRE
jgi:putative transposase